jgi:hypothetical protein
VKLVERSMVRTSGALVAHDPFARRTMLQLPRTIRVRDERSVQLQRRSVWIEGATWNDGAAREGREHR